MKHAIVASALLATGCYLSHEPPAALDAAHPAIDAAHPAIDASVVERCPSLVPRTFDIEILAAEPARCAEVGFRRTLELDLSAAEIRPEEPCVGHVTRASDGCALDFEMDCPIVDLYSVYEGRFDSEPPHGIVAVTTTGWGTCMRTERWTARP